MPTSTKDGMSNMLFDWISPSLSPMQQASSRPVAEHRSQLQPLVEPQPSQT